VHLIARLRDRITGLPPWRKRGALFVAGLLSAAALPPIHWVFLLFIALPPLLWLTEKATTLRQAFGTGWWFGLGHFAAGLYWVTLSFLVDIAAHGWMAPIAIIGLASGMALFLGLPTLGLRLLRLKGAAAVFGLAAFWVLSEWLRSWLLTGFPWNLMGSVWTFNDAMLQPAALIGVYGLSLITIATTGAPATLAAPGRKALATPLILLVLLGGFWGWGNWRLNQPEPTDHENIRLRIVQPNIVQADKWKPELRPQHIRTLLDLSTRDGKHAPTHLIWPETAVPYMVNRQATIRQTLAAVLPSDGALITGAPSGTVDGEAPFRVWNSVLAINASGSVTARYDKAHLVPFGEYVPFRSILPINKLTAGRGDFTPGSGLTSLTVKGLPPFSPLICYEVIFPSEVVAENQRPAWLLNVTNDAWFGVSSGPYQHFAAARLRAVEEGLPLVRSANTGISALIDAKGRVRAQLALEERGTIDTGLPKPTSRATPYSRFGNTIPLTLCGLMLVLAQGLNRRPEKVA